MNDGTAQEDRLRLLVEAFKADSVMYGDIQTPKDTEGRRRVLRSLMNVRMPGKMDEKVLALQDEYLRDRAREKGIVRPEDIPETRDSMALWQGDITRLAADAAVNAANSQMLGCFVPMHGCIDNCIHTFAGVELRLECYKQMEKLREKYGPAYEQPTAVPMLTDAYSLPAKKVIHIVGPVVEGALKREHEELLEACYVSVLDMCAENGLKTVAFCCISTGVFRFPGERAAHVAVRTTEKWLREHPGVISKVIFNVFKDEDRGYYERLLG